MKQKRFFILFLLFLCLSFLGLSYAYFGYSETQNTFEELGSKCFELTMTKDEKGITINKAHPITDEEGLKQEGYQFTIKNTCTSTAYYQVNIEDIEIEEKELPNQYIKASLNESKGKNINQYEKVDTTIEGATDSHKLTSGSLEPEEEKEYTLKLWMDNDTPAKEEVMNASYESKISIIASYIEEDKLENEITITYKEPENYSRESETVEITSKSENYKIIEYSIDGTTYEPVEKPDYEVTIKETYTEEGSYPIYFKDGMGNIKEENIETTKLDQSGPTITYEEKNSIPGENDWYKQLTINIKAEDKVGVESISYCVATEKSCEPDEESSIVLEEGYDITLESKAEEQRICTKAIDELGNESTSCSNPYKVDGVSPRITNIENPYEEEWTKEDVTIKININENESGNITCEEKEGIEEYTPLKGTYKEGIFTTEPYTGTQEKTYIIKCKDEAGNESEEKTETIQIDQTPPIISNIQTTKENRTISVQVTAKDNETSIKEKGYSYTLKREGKEIITVTSQSKTYTFVNLEMGSSYTIEAKVEDSVGNIGEQESNEITVPVVILGKEMNLVETGQGLYKVRHEEVEGTVNDEGFKQAEYRYAGTNPDNYIWYNCDEGYTHDSEHCEKWRIIGLVNVLIPQTDGSNKVEQRVKIIREESIQNVQWNDIPYVNDWNKASLMKLLNTGDYYNKQGIYDSIGLNENAKEKIDNNILWNLGGYGDPNLTMNEIYKYERSTNVFKDNNYLWQTDNHGVALMYPSDYGYASGGTTDKRNKCFSNTYISAYDLCVDENWLYLKNDYTFEWLLTHNTTYYDNVLFVYEIYKTYNGRIAATYGDVSYNRVTNQFRPTVYLKENVEIIGGTGKENDPYRATLNGEQVSIDILGKEVPLVAEGEGMYQVEHNDISGTENDSGFKQTEYRYAGSDPNNYIKFNDETWRIIGLVNVLVPQIDGSEKVEQRVKVIKNEDIGKLSWDLKDDLTGLNKWSESTLNRLLNGSYYNSQNMIFNNCTSYNFDLIKCATKEEKQLDFTTTGIKDNFRDMIEKVYWDTSIDTNAPGGNIKNLYIEERKGEKVLNNIGLIYPSDYNYTTGGSARNSCLNLLTWNNNKSCYGEAWLFLEKSGSLWTISASEAATISAHRVINDTESHIGTVATNHCYISNFVKPVLYLKNTLKITSGKGTQESPFEISLN